MEKVKKYSKYKDSRVEWIGEIPSEWQISKIKYQAIINSSSLGDSTDDNYEIEYLDIGNVSSTEGILTTEYYTFNNAPSRARRIVRNGDTIVSTVRTYLGAITTVRNAPNNLICSTGFAVLSPKKTIDSIFLSYLMRSQVYVNEIERRSTGVSYPATTSTEIGTLECIYPDLNTQKRIACFLDQKTSEIDSLIVDKEKLIELLEEKRQAIITEAVTKGLNPDVKMKDSGVEWIGLIPEHWVIGKLKYLSNERLQYGANETAELDDVNLPRYIRITDIDKRGNLKEDTFKSLAWDKAKDFILSTNDILFARSGATVGKTYFHEDSINACYAGYLIRYKPNINKVMPKFIYYFTQSHSYDSWIISNTIKATIQNVSAEKYANLNIPLPSLKEQNEIVSYIDRQGNIIREIQDYTTLQIKKLREYRQSLIYEAVTGKIDVRDYGKLTS